jgi:RHS repeat-associated protein
LTVAGATHIAATNVTVNSQNADRYADNAYSRTNLSLSDGNNTFTAVGYDALSRTDTTAITAFLPATANYQYDSNGNLIFDGLRGFAYDDENQLIRVTVTNDWKSEFVYDGKMRRRIRKEYSWQNGAWVLDEEVRYVYDLNLVIQERDRLNVSQVTYTRGKDLSGSLEGAGGIGGLLARTDNALLVNGTARTSAYYSTDGNGNITCLLDTNQIVVARYTFDPFGNTLAATGPMAEANLYRFSSKELHLQSGLVYYLYRFYDPNIQRWPNRDPIEEEGGLNLYGFVENDAVNNSDLFGLQFRRTIPLPFPFPGNPGQPRQPGKPIFWPPNQPFPPRNHPDRDPTKPPPARPHKPDCPVIPMLRSPALEVPSAKTVTCYQVGFTINEKGSMTCIYKCPSGPLRLRSGPVCEKFFIQDVAGPY